MNVLWQVCDTLCMTFITYSNEASHKHVTILNTVGYCHIQSRLYGILNSFFFYHAFM